MALVTSHQELGHLFFDRVASAAALGAEDSEGQKGHSTTSRSSDSESIALVDKHGISQRYCHHDAWCHEWRSIVQVQDILLRRLKKMRHYLAARETFGPFGAEDIHKYVAALGDELSEYV
eukprot:5505944-Amphidinium_carterae.1